MKHDLIRQKKERKNIKKNYRPANHTERLSTTFKPYGSQIIDTKKGRQLSSQTQKE